VASQPTCRGRRLSRRSFDRAAAHLFDEATGERREWTGGGRRPCRALHAWSRRSSLAFVTFGLSTEYDLIRPPDFNGLTIPRALDDEIFGIALKNCSSSRRSPCRSVSSAPRLGAAPVPRFTGVGGYCLRQLPT
jgi:hypothetical protein